jgi:hypothetical protein
MARDPAQGDAPRLKVEEEQHVVGGQTSPCQDFHREEIDPGDNCHVRCDELLSSRRLAASALAMP